MVRIPRRTCAACRAEAGQDELIRWVRADDGSVCPDLSGRSFGRGAWTHGRQKCLQRLQKALANSFKQPVRTPTERAIELLGEAANHRVGQLLGAARRQKLLVYGADAVQKAYQQGEATHVLLARDARSAAKSDHVTEAVTRGRAAAWGSKQALGRILGRSEVGILAVRDTGLAKRLFGAIAMALLAQNWPDKAGGADKIQFIE